MTVEDLIKVLREFDKDSKVITMDDGDEHAIRGVRCNDGPARDVLIN